MAKYNFVNHVTGDTFNGVLFTVYVNDVALDLTGAEINMDLRETPDGTLIQRYTTVDDGGLTILDPPTDGKFQFDRQVVSVTAGVYVYDIEIILSDGTIKTYISGKWNISKDVTHD